MSERIPHPHDAYSPRHVLPEDALATCAYITDLLGLDWGEEYVDARGRTLHYDAMVDLERSEACSVAIYEPVPHRDGRTTYTVTIQEQIGGNTTYREYQIVAFPDGGHMSLVSEPRIDATGNVGTEQDLRDMSPYDYTQLNGVLASFAMRDAA